MRDLGLIGLAVVLLGLNAFFVGAEFALLSARRTVIEPMVASGGSGARITLGAMENISLMLAGAQLGITICSLGLGSLGEPAVAHVLERPFDAAGLPPGLLHPLAFVLALALVVFLHVVIGEMVPKNIALAGPERTALVLAPLLVGVVTVLRPAVAALNMLANLSLRAIGVTPRDEVTSAFTRDEVAGLVAESHREGLLGNAEERRLSGALAFEERRARAVLLPMAHLTTVPPDITPEALEQLAEQTGFSRFPVLSEAALIGYVHLKDLLETDDMRRRIPNDPTNIRPLPLVAADDLLRTVLATMQRSRAHLATVTEGGRPLGVVALEDVLAELVGEIHDEHPPRARGEG